MAVEGRGRGMGRQGGGGPGGEGGGGGDTQRLGELRQREQLQLDWPPEVERVPHLSPRTPAALSGAAQGAHHRSQALPDLLIKSAGCTQCAMRYVEGGG